jgi:hypothetical protein
MFCDKTLEIQDLHYVNKNEYANNSVLSVPCFLKTEYLKMVGCINCWNPSGLSPENIILLTSGIKHFTLSVLILTVTFWK